MEGVASFNVTKNVFHTRWSHQFFCANTSKIQLYIYIFYELHALNIQMLHTRARG